MATFEVRLDLDAMRRLPLEVPGRIRKATSVALGIGLRILERRLVTERLSGSPLRRRTGALARGWKRMVFIYDGEVVGKLMTNVPYAEIHEFGGTIRPKRGKWLWIPGKELLTPAGVFRGWDQVVWDAVFYRRSKKNPRNLVVLQPVKSHIRGKKKGQTVLLHVATLVPEVTLPARMGLRDLAKAALPEIRTRMNAAIGAALSRGR